jgi:signal transduction histidine kinase
VSEEHASLQRVAALVAGGAAPADVLTALGEAREQLARLAEEQAALRRVATLVARGGPPEEVFDAVAEEAGRLLGVASTGLIRFEPDGNATLVGGWGRFTEAVPVGTRLPLGGVNVASEILRTGRPARYDRDMRATGPLGEHARRLHVRAAAGGPIVVAGRLWGAMTAAAVEGGPLPPDLEPRLAQFTELVATAVANAEARRELEASRARVLSAGDEARRQVARDLHDGAQQRLVHAIITLKLARHALREDADHAESLLGEALEQAEQGNAALRELAHGILPVALTRGGLRAGVHGLVARLGLPVSVQVTDARLPRQIEASAYFIVAEALTNVIKHAHATKASVTAAATGGALHVEVRDDGMGGADPDGHGLLGIGDRVAALGGRLALESPPGGGTRLTVELPVSRGAAGGSSPMP